MSTKVYVLVSGGARMKIGEEMVDLEPWTAVRLPKDTMRSIKTGPGDALMEQEWWSD